MTEVDMMKDIKITTDNSEEDIVTPWDVEGKA